MSNVMNLTARLSQLGKELVIAQNELGDVQRRYDYEIAQEEIEIASEIDDLLNQIDTLEDKISDIQDEIADCEEELDELSNQHTVTEDDNW